MKLLSEKLLLVTNSSKEFIPQKAIIYEWLKACITIAFCGVLLVLIGISQPWHIDTNIQVWIAAVVASIVFFQLGRFLSKHLQYYEIVEKNANWNKLSVREVDVAKLLLTSLTNKEICAELFIEYNTLKTHIRSIYKKTHCNSRSLFVQRFKDLLNEKHS